MQTQQTTSQNGARQFTLSLKTRLLNATLLGLLLVLVLSLCLVFHLGNSTAFAASATVTYSEIATFNTKDTATIIPLNSPIRGNLSYDGEEVWYKFTTTQDGHFNVSFEHSLNSGSNYYWRISLYDDSGVNNIDGINSSLLVPGNNNAVTNKYGIAAGTYYIKITNYYYVADNYTLTVNFTAANNWETENNNAMVTADVIQVNQPIHGCLTNSSDVDWYTFTVNEKGHFNVSFDHALASYSNDCWYMYIYDNSGVNDVDGSSPYNVKGNSNTVTNNLGVPSGTYYIKIEKGLYHSAAEYTLTVNFTAANDWETENNNTKSDADVIQANQPVHGSLSWYKDVDWYELSITDNGYISLSFEYTQEYIYNDYCTINIYNDDGIFISANIDYSFNINANPFTGKIGVSVGTYYIQIVGSSFYAQSDYTLTVNFTAVSGWETENNNSMDTANLIQLNKSVRGALSWNNDVDWYKFTTTQNGYFNVSFEYTVLSADVSDCKIYLYDASGELCIDGTDYYYSVASKSSIVTFNYGIPVGTYYIKISKDDHYSHNEYSLTVNFTAANNWETENNNSIELADELSLQQLVYGTLAVDEDEDWYKFTISTTCDIGVAFNHSAPSAASFNGWMYYICDSSGREKFGLGGYDYSGSSQPTGFVKLSAGTYYIKVVHSGSGMNYSLCVTEPHEHEGVWETTVEPTCTNHGTQSKVCTICSCILTKKIDPLGHTFDDKGVRTKKTTLTQNGEILHTCSTCGAQYTVEDASKKWILPVICVVAVLAPLGIFNYIRAAKKKKTK